MAEPTQFELEISGNVLILAACGETGTLAEDQAGDEWETLLERIDQEDARHAIVDLGELDYFGSILLYFLVRLWKRISARGGKMAVCNVSKVGDEILRTARFDTLWPIVNTRKEALRAVQQ